MGGPVHVCMCHAAYVLNSDECRDYTTLYLRLLFPITSPGSLLSAKTCNMQQLYEDQGSGDSDVKRRGLVTWKSFTAAP